MNIEIKTSNKPNKKYVAVINNKKNHFGDSRYEDFTTHKNEARNKSDLSRHKNDNFNNVNYAGFYATNLLWNKKHWKNL